MAGNTSPDQSGGVVPGESPVDVSAALTAVPEKQRHSIVRELAMLSLAPCMDSDPGAPRIVYMSPDDALDVLLGTHGKELREDS